MSYTAWRTDDIDELRARLNQGGWRTEVLQLSRGGLGFESRSVVLPGLSVAFCDYRQSLDFREIKLDGKVQTYSYRHRCSDTINRHTIVGGRFCSGKIRVDKWEDDPTEKFARMYFGESGAYFWYDTGSRPDDASQVDPAIVNVDFDLDVP